MLDKREMLKSRDEYISLIKAELLGPGSEVSIPDAEHELISDSPEARYSIGILFAKNNKMNADINDTSRVENNDNAEDDDNIDLTSSNTQEGYVHHMSSVNMPEEENLDEEIGLATQNMPSSMGITFFVRGNCDYVKCKIKFATYRKAIATDCRIPFAEAIEKNYKLPEEFNSYIRIDSEEQTLRLSTGGLNRKIVRLLEERDILEQDPYGVISAMYKLSDQLKNGYVRVPHEIDVELDFTDSEYIDQNKKLSETDAKVTALRRKIDEEISSITVMLVNDVIGRSKSTLCLFQPEIRIYSENNQFVFADYINSKDFSSLDEEEKSLALQYRNKRIYGTGLGTSVNWKIDHEGKGFIQSDYFPEYEVPSMDFSLNNDTNVSSETLSMKYLSDLCEDGATNKIEKLTLLVNEYEKWIEKTKNRINTLEERYQNIANKNMVGCEKSLKRMKKGLSVIKENNLAWQAFELANRAMFMQRVHLKLQDMTANINRYPDDQELSELIEEIDYYTIDQKITDSYSWRPFQIAFLLMSIESITDDNCSDRDIVDLIWFPTGGGKTEAYLGLTAFTIFYRRLANLNESSGTAVIMRYTLRLLTAQQFTRAATLICACEYIRDDATSRRPIYKKYSLGKESITIGLWIGGDHTPNKNEQAKKELNRLLKASIDNLEYEKNQHNKFQVLKCPWCGTKLVKDRDEKGMKGSFGYRMKNNRHFEFYCPQESCYFNSVGKLPIQVVDEELYDNPPTLLFGTVDKFAMLPWNEKIGAFFATNSSNRTPELIIQDELHLISGPLGTMVGLYEAAIDAISANKNIKPKIIASTATIRRAVEQCYSLYNREAIQFPHPAIDSEDSFFARETVIDYDLMQYGRKYVGLMASGKTKAMMEIRAISALLQLIHSMELDYEIKDKYWTLTVYFNSLKDLGKCSTLVDDDIKDAIKRMSYRLGTARNARLIMSADELTSRVSTTELNETLDKLEKVGYTKENIENKRWPSNILLATNMISVGIDVARLNVMIMVGQPKLTSEYIQASSRVGRAFPGVVFTLYDGSKSRDRSHYEQFVGYHGSFYKYVEPTGVTPFSKPARDRALHAAVIAMIRQLVPELSGEKCVQAFSRSKYEKEIKQITDFIVQRNNNIISKINSEMDTEDEIIREEISEVFRIWEELMKDYEEEHFSYGEKYLVTSPDEGEGRLMKAYNSSKYDPAFDTMTSMRNVDISVGSSILVWEEE